MHSTSLDYNPGAGKRKTGLIVVVILHILIVWGLVSGLARKAVEIIKKPIEMKIMEEVKLPPPPPPPPPPKVEKIQDLPKPQAPPPPFVPPPDIAPPVQQTAPVIQATQAEVPKAPPPIAPPAPPTPPAPPAPPSRVEASIACPGYQKTLQAALSGAFEKVGVEGTVKVLIKLKGGQIVEVTPQSGPRDYYRLVQGAVRRLQCSTGGADELLVPLDIVFKEE